MSTLGFEEYVEPLKLYLHKYREVSPTPSQRRRRMHRTPRSATRSPRWHVGRALIAEGVSMVLSIATVCDDCRAQARGYLPGLKAVATRVAYAWAARGWGGGHLSGSRVYATDHRDEQNIL